MTAQINTWLFRETLEIMVSKEWTVILCCHGRCSKAYCERTETTMTPSRQWHAFGFTSASGEHVSQVTQVQSNEPPGCKVHIYIDGELVGLVDPELSTSKVLTI